MSKDKNKQGKLLKVVNWVDEPKEGENIGPDGQAKLYEIKKEFVPEELKPFANYMNNRLSRTERKLEESTDQNRRLANSLETIIPKFVNQSVSNDGKADLVLKNFDDGEKPDVVIVDGTTIPAELAYTLSTGQIANKIGNKEMTASRMGKLLRDFGIYGNSNYHHTFPTSEKSFCQKYKPLAIKAIYERLREPEEYGIHPSVAAKYANYIRPTEAI